MHIHAHAHTRTHAYTHSHVYTNTQNADRLGILLSDVWSVTLWGSNCSLALFSVQRAGQGLPKQLLPQSVMLSKHRSFYHASPQTVASLSAFV